jgi:hypothetical protein
MRVDCTGEVRQPRQPCVGIGIFRSSRPNPVHMRRGQWADAAPVSGIKCLGLVKSRPGDEFPVIVCQGCPQICEPIFASPEISPRM